MSILRRLLGINSNTPEVKEAIGFNPANAGLIEGDGVAYGLSYQDNGNGSSKVKLLISLLYQSKTYECGTNTSVANEFKSQLSLTLIEDSAEVDKIGVIFPTEEINEEGKKYIKSLMFNTYKIQHSTNAPSVEHLSKTKLQKNINNTNDANKGNSYFQPKAVKVGNGNVVVIAHNLKDQALVSWYLESKGDRKFIALPGANGIIERKLFKFDNPGQLVLDENTMLYAQMSKSITEASKTQIFKFSVAEVVRKLKDGKRDECLLSKKGCQIDNKALSLSKEYEISFLQYVKRTKDDHLVAFLENDQSSNTQKLHLASLVKSRSKSNFIIHEFKDPVDQLYVKDNGQGGFIVTAISGESIITFNRESSGKSSEATIIPANSIKALSDFVNIINGQLTPSIISSSTVAPITTTKTVITSKEGSTAAITDALKTTKLTTEASTIIVPTSTMSKPSTKSTTQASTVTVEPTTVAKTTTTSQATTITATSTNVPSETETSTVKPTAATVASTSTMNKPSTTQTSTVTVKPTTVAKTTTTSQATTITATSTNVPSETETSTIKPTATTVASTSTMSKPSTTQTSTEKTTQTVFIIPSTRTRESTTPIFTMTSLPQTTSLPQPTQLAIGSNRAGMIGGSLVGAIGIVGIIGFIAYRYVKGRNAAPVLELTDLGYRRRSSSSSDEEIFTTGDRMRTIYQSETVLNSISVESSSRSRSSSSSSSSGPGS